MAITYSIVPIPMWYMAGLTGLPNPGSMATFQSTAKNTKKPVYSDAGGQFPYPNPLNFGANGELPGGTGSMMFWANDVPYYVQIFDGPNGTGNLLYTFDGYGPNIAGGGGGSVTTNNTFLENYITNNVFFRNVGIQTNPISGTVLAPSNHEGFRQSDIQYLKGTGSSSTETISFPSFGAANNPLAPSDVTPEFYMQWNCTVAGTEASKAIQFPIDLHVKNLEGQTMTFMVWLKNGGGGSLSVTASFIQDTGTGAVSSPVSTAIPINASPITNQWQIYIGNFVVPNTNALSLGAGGDDASYIQLNLPTTPNTGTIQIAKPKLYLGNFQSVFAELPSYDYVDRIINSPRTGDYKLSFSTYSLGWVAANDGTIGNASSNATSRANQDTWQLYNLLWAFAKTYDAGSGAHSNPICQLVNSAGSNIDYGSTAIADFSANNAITLSKTFGQVLMGTVPIASLLSKYTQAITASNSSGNLLITVSNGSALYNGMPIAFTTTGSLPGNIVSNAIYYATGVIGNSFEVATTFANSVLGIVVAWSSAGSNSSMVCQITGSTTGEYTNLLDIGHIPSHNHTVPGGSFITTGGNAEFNNSGANAGQASNVTNNTGSGVAHNNIQPSTSINVFIKL